MIYIFLSLVPYACLPGTVWVFALKRRPGTPFFTALLNGALAWSLAVWGVSNLFSWTDGLYRPTFIIFWLLYSTGLAWLIWKDRRNIRRWRPCGLVPVSMAVICLCALVAALVYPPNMWDVLSYHLPRAMHWLQNHNLAPYPTNIPRQIGMPPFNSMVAMQSLGMEGGDYFVHLGQWFAFIGLIIGGMRVAAQLGGSERSQLLAGLFIATLPNAFIQASNTESSDIVAFWIVAMASVFLDWLKTRDRENAIRFGCCIGLAMLSKGSAYAAAFPFVLAFAFFCLRSPRRLLLQGVAAAAVILAINAPHFTRVYQAYGSIVGGTERNILYRPTPGTFAVNAAYNFLLHEPWLLRGPLFGMWDAFPAALGVDVNDRSVFPWGGLDKNVSKWNATDTAAQNVIQALLLLALLVATIIRKFRPPALYSSLVGGTFVFYWLFLTWHPWAGRIHTSMFILAAPLAGMYMDSWTRKGWRNAVVAFMLIWTFFAFQHGLRRLGLTDHYGRNFLYHTRNHLYFNNYDYYRGTYADAVNFLSSQRPKSIGVDMYDDAFEYPLWALLSQNVEVMPKIFHITSEKDAAALKPEFILKLGGAERKVNPLDLPIVFKRENGGYARVFPAGDDLSNDVWRRK